MPTDLKALAKQVTDIKTSRQAPSAPVTPAAALQAAHDANTRRRDEATRLLGQREAAADVAARSGAEGDEAAVQAQRNVVAACDAAVTRSGKALKGAQAIEREQERAEGDRLLRELEPVAAALVREMAARLQALVEVEELLADIHQLANSGPRSDAFCHLQNGLCIGLKERAAHYAQRPNVAAFLAQPVRKVA